jgi:hypothetical protein
MRARRRQAEEWMLISKMIRDKELSGDHAQVLKSFLAKHAQQTPFEVVNDRRQFDRCIDREMAALLARRDPALFQQMGAFLREIRIGLGLDYVKYGQRIDSTRELRTGQVLWLYSGDSPAGKWTQATVLFVDEAYLHVAPSRVFGQVWPQFRAGEKVRCRFWREDDGRYGATLRIDRVNEKPLTWFFLHTAQFERTQARCFYRVRCDLQTGVRILSDKQEGRLASILGQFHAIISSLSAGGLALTALQSPPKNRLLRVGLVLPKEMPLDVDVSVIAIENLAGGRFLIRGTFVDMDSEGRDIIARYVAARQQMLLARHEDAGNL